MFECLPPGCRVRVVCESDQVNLFRFIENENQVNLFRVIENEDGTYSPLSESWSGSSIRNLFAEEESEEAARRLQENSVTMGKMQELRSRMEKLSLQKKPKKPTPRVLSGKRTSLHNRRGTPRPQRSHKSKSQEHIEVPQINGQSNVLQLPPINKSENVMSTTPYQQHSSGGVYLATSSILQAQNQLQTRRTRGLETKQSISASDYGSNLTVTVNKHGRRRSQQHNLPAIVSTSHPFSDSKKINDSTENSGHLLDMKPRQYSDYRHGSSVTSGHHTQMTKNSREELSLRSSQGVSVISTPNIATVEEDSDSPMGKEEPDFSAPPNPIIVPSKEATTFTVSQIHQERVLTPVGSSQNRYRVSQLILDDDRPRTSPDELTKQEKAAQELCAIVSDTKWHKQKQQQKIHCSNSQSELLGNLPVEQRKNESNPKDFLQEKRSRIDLTLPLQSSLIDVRIQSPRYGRRSVILPAVNHDVKHNRLECDVTAMHPRQFSSGHGSLLHPALNTVGQFNQHTLSLSQELAPQSLPLVSTKKQSTVRSRCSECRKRLNITNVYTCRCDKLFCATHRYSELHNCTFDYKTDGRKILERTNPLVTAQKLPKI